MGREITLVVIHSLSYTGTTYINLILGTRPGAISLGPPHRAIQMLAEGPERAGEICRIHGESCDLFPPFARTYDPSGNFFVQLADFRDLDTIVINNPIGGDEVMRHLRDERLRVVDLAIVRDGRAVVNSYLRRQPGSDLLTATRDWFVPAAHRLGAVHTNGFELPPLPIRLGVRGRLARLIGRGPKRSSPTQYALTEQYERVIEDPHGYLSRAAEVIGGSYPATATSFWLHPHHLSSANPGPVGTFKRHAGIPFAGPDAAMQEERYQKQIASPDTPPLDLRWKREFDERDLAVFDHFAGETNASWGYQRDAISEEMRSRVRAELAGRTAEQAPGVQCDNRADGEGWDPGRPAVPARSFDDAAGIGSETEKEDVGALG